MVYTGCPVLLGWWILRSYYGQGRNVYRFLGGKWPLGRLRTGEADGTDSRSCPVADFGFTSAEPLISATGVFKLISTLVTYQASVWWAMVNDLN
jgi:hypothetical protein